MKKELMLFTSVKVQMLVCYSLGASVLEIHASVSLCKQFDFIDTSETRGLYFCGYFYKFL